MVGENRQGHRPRLEIGVKTIPHRVSSCFEEHNILEPRRLGCFVFMVRVLVTSGFIHSEVGKFLKMVDVPKFRLAHTDFRLDILPQSVLRDLDMQQLHGVAHTCLASLESKADLLLEA